MSATAHQVLPRPFPASLALPVCALATAVAVATVTIVGTGREVGGAGFRLERELSPILLVLLGLGLVVGSLVPWLLVGEQSRMAVALAAATATSQWPLWAGWDQLTPGLRALSFCPTSLVAGALATAFAGAGDRVARSALTAGVVSAALSAAAFDPFHDVDCPRLRTCLASPRAIGGHGADLALFAANVLAVVAVAAALVALARSRGTGVVRMGAGIAVALAGLVLVTGHHTIDVRGHELVTDVPLAVATAQAAVMAGARRVRTLLTRRAADRLIPQLTAVDPPDHLPDSATLSPAQRLALENALLMARSRATLLETRSLQRMTQQRADDERERIERDLHDGAQQQLVGAAIQLGVAASTGPATQATALESARTEVLAALESLREIGHGLFPRALVEEGLSAALDDLSAEHRVALTVSEPFRDTSDVQVARAAYAVVAAFLEGDSCASSVYLAGTDHVVEVRVVGGCGPLPRPVLDRVLSVGGEVEAEHDGTTVVLPCGS